MDIASMTLTGLFVWSSFGTSAALTMPETVIEAPEPSSERTVATHEEAVKELVDREFGEGHIMVTIARCESNYRQFHNGDVLRGKVNKKDVGVFQINEGYHLASAKKMELDIHSTGGNIAYARHLYNTKGTAPWKWSKPCWSK